MAEADAMRKKLEQWRQRTGRKPMKRFSYVAEYCPTDLSIKLATPSVVTSKSTVKRKPLGCLNLLPNQISEQDLDQINIKLCFNDDFLSTGDRNKNENLEDNEITINPAKRKRHRSLIVEPNIMFESTSIRYTTFTPRRRFKGDEGFLVMPVKRSTRCRSMSTPGYLDDQKSCYNSPSDISTSETVVVLPNKYL